MKGKIFAVVAVLLLMSSCRTIHDVEERVVVRTDTCYVSKVEKDSIYFRDSVYVIEKTVGDTCYITKTVERVRWRDRVKIDTCWQSKTDTVTVTKTETITKNEGWLGKVKSGMAFLGACTLLIAAALVLRKLVF